jgi:hypothetical protein
MNRKDYHTNMNIPEAFNIPAIVNYKYMLIVQPGGNILDRIKRIQRKWTDEYGLKPGQLQSGYLLLARFNQHAAHEERLLRKLHYAAMESAPYRVSIEGFFGLPDHSVGLKINNPAPVKLINRTIQNQLSGLKFPGEKPYFNQYPAIGMATKLLPTQYHATWKAHEHRHFSASFIADHIIVLRKGNHASGWSVLNRFTFENIPIQSKQGVLFA